MEPRNLAVACAAALLAIVAIVLACTVASTQGYAQERPRDPLAASAVRDAGANPCGRMGRPML